MSQINRTNEISGFWLSFSREEIEYINERLSELGYEEAPKGLKDLISDVLENIDEENPGDRVIKRLSQYIAGNPDKVRMYADLAAGAVKGFGKYIKKGRL